MIAGIKLVCHINMLTTYVDSERSYPPSIVAPVAMVTVAQPPYNPSDDGLTDRRSASEILSNLDAHLAHLSVCVKLP